MNDYTPTTDAVQVRYSLSYGSQGGYKGGLEEFDRWLAAHDAEVRASVAPEIGMPCADTKPHPAHAWQMSATGWCLCPGVVAEEPEWEYMNRFGSLVTFEQHATVKRRKAGPWVPVKQEGAGREGDS